MNISKKMSQTLNEQVLLEIEASNKYLAMACWCEVNGYEGGASYFYAQSDEERMHLIKLVKFLNNTNAPAVIPASSKPSVEFGGLEDVLKAALAGEQKVTKAVTKAVELAKEKTEIAVMDTLLWFANEQVEEETKFEALLQKFDTIGRDPIAINEIDKILASQAAQE